MASNWIEDLTGQRVYDNGIEIQPTKKEWNITGADIAYNPLTKRVDINLGGGVGNDWKQHVRVASQVNLNATRTDNTLMANVPGDINAAGGVDGVAALAVDNRVLIRAQTAPQDNGIYVIESLGDALNPWVMNRAPLSDETGEVQSGLTCYVSEGTLGGESRYVMTAFDPITLNTSPLVFIQDGIGGTVPGGPASGDLAGSYPSPTCIAVTDSGATQFPIGAVANSEALVVDGGGSVVSTALGLNLSGTLDTCDVIGLLEAGGNSLLYGAVADQELLLRDGATVIGSPLNVYGTERQYSESLAITTSNTGASIAKLGLSHPVVPAGSYQLRYSTGWNHDATTDDIRIRIIDGGGAGIWNFQAAPADAGGLGPGGTDQRYAVSGFIELVYLVPTANAFRMLFNSIVVGVNSSLWDTRMEFIRVE